MAPRQQQLPKQHIPLSQPQPPPTPVLFHQQQLPPPQVLHPADPADSAADSLSSSPSAASSSPYLDFARFVNAHPQRFDTWAKFDDADLRSAASSDETDTDYMLSPSEASVTSSFVDDSATEDQTTSPTTTTTASSTSPLPAARGGVHAHAHAHTHANHAADIADAAAVVRRSSSIHRRYQDRRMRQGRLLLVSMLENFCALYDESPERNRRLFYVICKQLHHMGIIDADDFLDELSTVRGSYKRAFRDLVVRAMASIRDQDQQATLKFEPSTFGATADGTVPPPPMARNGSSSLVDQRAPPPLFGPGGVSPLLPLRSSPAMSSHGSSSRPRPTFSSVWDARSSRYAEDFVELEMLGKGAFGRVYRVRNRLDGIEYAIKKVRLRMGTSKLERLLREVKFQARLTHGNVVRYFSAWVEDIPDDRSSTSARGRPPAQQQPNAGMAALTDHANVETPSETRSLSLLRQSPPDFLQSPWTHRGRITEVHTDASDEDAEESLGRVTNNAEEDVDIVFTDDQDDITSVTGATSETSYQAQMTDTEAKPEVVTPPSPAKLDISKRRGSFFEKPSSAGDSDDDSRVMDSGSESWEQPSTPQALVPSVSLSTVVAEDVPTTASNPHPPLVSKPPPARSSHHPPPPPPSRVPPPVVDHLPSSLRLTLLIQMELCSHTLQDFLRERNERCFAPQPDGSLPKPAVVDTHQAHTIFRDLAEGLLYVHSMGCIHRDIKPKNIYWKSTTTGYGQATPALAAAAAAAAAPPPQCLPSPACVNGAWKIGDFGLVTAADLNGGGESDGACGVRQRRRQPEKADDSDHRQDPPMLAGADPDSVSDREGDECGVDGMKPFFSARGGMKSSPHGSLGGSVMGDGGAGAGTPPRRHLARSVTSCSDRTIGVGTVTYASPEQLHPSQSTPYSSASDIYSLGIVLFELLQPFQTGMERARALQDLRAGAAAASASAAATAGATPTTTTTTTHPTASAAAPDAAFQAAFPAETALIRRMMSQDPEQRPAAAELCAWCEDVLREHGGGGGGGGGGRSRTAEAPAATLLKCADPVPSLATEAGDRELPVETPTNPMTLVPPDDHRDPLIEQNRALKVRVEELERRLQALGVSV
ncbi:Eukaryotic translation initiation factor 2-alpha kinase [Geranomyces variabilis]|uniref:non-specific serine/threonine protein kinase n=1 Tax=Geranomyces variabilis TaxID=109894 RepID=A0AAD5TPV0_9FUNG|nr:Eukaryotic translation initiation factor 2-alpha kinase [Geranomyces variabilis]